MRWLLGCLLIGLGSSAVAQHQERIESSVIALRGSAAATELYEAQRYEEALSKFREAFLYDAEPELLFNIGLCYIKLGRANDAKVHLQRFLDKALLSRHRDEAKALLQDLSTPTALLVASDSQLGPKITLGSAAALGGAGFIIGSIGVGKEVHVRRVIKNAQEDGFITLEEQEQINRTTTNNDAIAYTITADTLFVFAAPFALTGGALYYANKRQRKDIEANTLNLQLSVSMNNASISGSF